MRGWSQSDNVNVGDYVGYVFMLLWGTYAMWLVNKVCASEDTLVSLFTRWPKAYPKEFFVWGGMSTVIMGLLCLFLLYPMIHRSLPNNIWSRQEHSSSTTVSTATLPIRSWFRADYTEGTAAATKIIWHKSEQAVRLTCTTIQPTRTIIIFLNQSVVGFSQD